MHISRLLLTCTLICAVPSASAAAPVPNEPISAKALREDIEFMFTSIRDNHPDLALSTGEAAMRRAADDIARTLPDQMTRDEAWRHLAQFNPVLEDGHLLVGIPDWRAAVARYRAAGGRLFPFEVRIDAAGRLLIDADLGGAPSSLAGARIASIDGMPAETRMARLLARMHGDTPAFRSNLLALRWWLYDWKLNGPAASYTLLLERDGKRWTLDVPASATQPRLLREECDLARLYRLDIQPGGSAVMTVGSFDGTYHAHFVAFARDAFARLRRENVGTLVIDISANGGGDDAMWLDGLMPYLATQPYRTGSDTIKRVLKDDPARGERAGQIVHGQIVTWREPQPAQPDRFTGKVEVRIGPGTYSSAVLFANVMQDFGFARLVGQGGAARRTQSGGIRMLTLPHSGLELWLPRFVIAPPGKAPRPALLEAQGPML